MIPTITKDSDDHILFIENLNKISQHWIKNYEVNDIFITKIDNWFDQKWMRFSGTIMHEISVWAIFNIKIPPFHPNRVKRTNFYKKQDDIYFKSDVQSPLHIYQTSSDNLKRKIIDVTTDGLLIWYSGNSELNGVGSIMTYLVKDGECETSFITLKKEKEWSASQTNGVLMREIKEVLNN